MSLRFPRGQWDNNIDALSTPVYHIFIPLNAYDWIGDLLPSHAAYISYFYGFHNVFLLMDWIESSMFEIRYIYYQHMLCACATY